MATWLSTDGTPYGGDRQIRPDGDWDPEIPDRPSLEHKWIDGEWQYKPNPDWDGFFSANLLTLVALLTTSPQPVLADFLKIEFAKRPSLDLGRLVEYWNGAIAPIPPSTEQIAALRASATANHLPVDLDEAGQMVIL